uniref:Uncharacterized protein n=1 Tax=Arsenophonus endosymbiont of Trialeurodes vaporariorum TaxID=235567 RepID=A0A3B0M1X6_9GAMM
MSPVVHLLKRIKKAAAIKANKKGSGNAKKVYKKGKKVSDKSKKIAAKLRAKKAIKKAQK